AFLKQCETSPGLLCVLILLSTIPKWVHHALTPVVEALEDYIPQPYAGRSKAWPHTSEESCLISMLNFAYEVTAFCTSIVKGEVAYTGTSFAGYVGLWTGQSPNKFTVSGDQEVRLLEKTEISADAVMRLSKIPIITGVYYIVGGVRPGEGVVITRDRKGPADIWPLEPVDGGWYRVETNFDHWLPPPARDHRREAANKALNATGQEHINADTLFQASTA
uniref:Uncharacterized protein n=1 Tax=Salarias fasciatus TaxID=181472 RepID=A0A672IDP1_SALFA